MANEIVVHDTRIEIPPANHPGFKMLAPTIQRLPQYFPPGAAGAQLAAAIIAEANKKTLADCTPTSIAKTAFNAAVLGLIPGDFMGFAHFVPFRDNKRQCVECQLIVGYKGWLELAYDGDFLLDVHSEVVLNDEEFSRWNDENGPHVRHVMTLDRDENLKWPMVRAAYCVWHSRSGGRGIEFVGRKALDTLKRRGNVWDSNPIAMALKTPIIRAAKTWRRTRRIAMASALEDALDAESTQPSLVEAPVDEAEATPQLEAFAGQTDDDQEGDF